MLEIEATINQHIAYITPNSKEVLSSFLQLFLESAYAELRAISSASGSTRPALTCEDIKRFAVAVPPPEEQVQIISTLRNHISRINHCMDIVQRQCAAVQELGTRIITAAVTGKVDVRELTAMLPEIEDDFEGDVDERLLDDTAEDLDEDGFASAESGP